MPTHAMRFAISSPSTWHMLHAADTHMLEQGSLLLQGKKRH